MGSGPDGEPTTGLTVVCGAAREAVATVGEALRVPAGAVLVAHDLRGLGEGVVHRRVVDGAGARTTVLELAHGCVSCTLREDLLPLLRRLARDPLVGEVVLLLDPGLEPEAVCEALHTVLPEGEDTPVVAELALRGVVGVIDVATWLDDAGSDEALAERGGALTADDERTVAQVVVGHAEFVDLLVLAGRADDAWERTRLDAVLDRLAPRTRRVGAPDPAVRLPDLAAMLAALPADARRGEPDDPHGPLLRGEPPLSRDAGVALVHIGHRRPFHPQRLHDAIEVLLTGTVRVRGRVWVASQPEHVLWLESAGGGLQIGLAGRWLAAGGEAAWDDVDPERRAAAALRWDERFGDREQQLVALVHDADPERVIAALDEALVTDAELAAGEAVWRTWADPFEHRHVDPCDDLAVTDEPAERGDRRAP